LFRSGGGSRFAQPSFPRCKRLGFDCLLEAPPAEPASDLPLQHGRPVVCFLSPLHASRPSAAELDRAGGAAIAVPDGHLLGLSMEAGRALRQNLACAWPGGRAADRRCFSRNQSRRKNIRPDVAAETRSADARPRLSRTGASGRGSADKTALREQTGFHNRRSLRFRWPHYFLFAGG